MVTWTKLPPPALLAASRDSAKSDLPTLGHGITSVDDKGHAITAASGFLAQPKKVNPFTYARRP